MMKYLSLGFALPWVVIAEADPLSGGAGWVGAGLLGLVLMWVFLVHMPSLSKALRELLDTSALERKQMTERYDKERDTEREARHERADQFQQLIMNLAATFKTEIKDIEQQHRMDATADREAFMQRNLRIEEAIRTQTIELKMVIGEAMKGMCRFVIQNQVKP